MKNINVGDIINIKFLDCESFPGWNRETSSEEVVIYLYAVGYFLKKDNNFTFIYMGYNDEGGILNIQKIPNGCVIDIKKIK
jgi:hypothetical protein